MDKNQDCVVFFNSVYPDLIGSTPATYKLSDCCNQVQFVCNGGRLNAINLSGLDFDGVLSPNIGQFSELMVLSLQVNRINGKIPNEIGQLTNLQILKLNNNKLVSKLPDSMINLKKLHTFYMGMNKLFGPIDVIGKLTNLEELDLSRNEFSGGLPVEFSQFAKLQSLFLSSNNITGTIPPQYGDISTLKSLTLAENKLTGTIPKELGNLKNVEMMFLNSNSFLNEIVPNEILQLPKYNPRNFRFRNDDSFSSVYPSSTNYQSMSYQTSSRPTNNQAIGNGNSEMTGLIVVISIFIAITFFITLLVFMYKRTARKVSPKKIVKQKMYSEDNSVASKESTVVEENMENGMEKPSLLYDSRLIIKKKLAGSGGCGAVYQANYSGVEAVAKIPRLEKHERLIYEEAQMMQKLKSPWVVNVLHFMGNTSIRIPNQDYTPQTALLIEFMNLGSFSKYLTTPNFHHDQPSEFTMTQYKSVLSQTHSLTLMAARGIEYLHSLGYNHLDIKPDNILLNQESDGKIIAKISDFGSTRLNGSSDCVFQTLAYIPPEGLPKSTEKPVVGLTGAPVNSEVVQSNVFVPNLALGSVSYLPSDFDPVPNDPTKIIKTYKYDIYAFGCCLVNIATFHRTPKILTKRSTLESRRSFLQIYLENNQLISLILSCLESEPYKRPTAIQIISVLESLQQSDFNINHDTFIEPDITKSILPTIGMSIV